MTRVPVTVLHNVVASLLTVNKMGDDGVVSARWQNVLHKLKQRFFYRGKTLDARVSPRSAVGVASAHPAGALRPTQRRLDGKGAIDGCGARGSALWPRLRLGVNVPALDALVWGRG